MLLSNSKGTLPLKAGARIYAEGVDVAMLKARGFTVAERPEDADVALLRVVRGGGEGGPGGGARARAAPAPAAAGGASAGDCGGWPGKCRVTRRRGSGARVAAVSAAWQRAARRST